MNDEERAYMREYMKYRYKSKKIMYESQTEEEKYESLMEFVKDKLRELKDDKQT